MKENNYKQSKIAEIIQDWWDNPPEVVEEWVVSGKQKKATQPESQNIAPERRAPGGAAGRGRTREAVAGGLATARAAAAAAAGAVAAVAFVVAVALGVPDSTAKAAPLGAAADRRAAGDTPAWARR